MSNMDVLDDLNDGFEPWSGVTVTHLVPVADANGGLGAAVSSSQAVFAADLIDAAATAQILLQLHVFGYERDRD